ncbi:HpcH/HpaI aldolase/citrate lyase family protein [Halegenticoccus tardaugens]|uniref:HpcH/HpaI aldolase/citrate lyase family protein n=1 Tax=Halegenticoccus tardaugens TaxID=2071624 RepID=UPI00100BDD71|nr:CoA ester lyase [Halegenticoccus tardaugens]
MSRPLRRSFLYTPADDRSMMEKSATLPSDAVIFDLEDAIPAAAVPEARARIASVTKETAFDSTEVCVRINGYQSKSWIQDLQALAGAAIDTVILPMIESERQLETMVAVAEQLSESPPEAIPTIETPSGLFALSSIAARAKSLPSVTGLSYGFGDYVNAIGATGRPSQVRWFLRHHIVGAAAVGNLSPVDTVYQDHTDLEGLREAAERAREIGYIGQKVIHPSQLDVINDVFTPTPEEVEKARRFVETFADSPKDAITVDGVFLDTAIVDQYKTLLARHEEVRS